MKSKILSNTWKYTIRSGLFCNFESRKYQSLITKRYIDFRTWNVKKLSSYTKLSSNEKNDKIFLIRLYFFETIFFGGKIENFVIIILNVEINEKQSFIECYSIAW